MKISNQGWTIATDPDHPDYLYLQVEGMPGAIHIKRSTEGVVVDIWNQDQSDVIAGTCATFSELVDAESELDGSVGVATEGPFPDRESAVKHVGASKDELWATVVDRAA